MRGCPRLGLVLTNLADNAVKYSDHGRITLRASLAEPAAHVKTSVNAEPHADSLQVRFEIEDQGIGISTEHQAILFNAFEQADISSTRKYGGLGLGLALCKRLTELMGGTIDVRCIPGQGSTFWITVPLRRAMDAHSAKGVAPSDRSKEISTPFTPAPSC